MLLLFGLDEVVLGFVLGLDVLRSVEDWDSVDGLAGLRDEVGAANGASGVGS